MNVKMLILIDAWILNNSTRGVFGFILAETDKENLKMIFKYK